MDGGFISHFVLLRYTVKVQRELELDECAIRALGEDRKRFLCKAVENYIMCLLSGEEHDMWIFRLCSLWLENSGLSEVNAMIQVGLAKVLFFCFMLGLLQIESQFGTVFRKQETECLACLKHKPSEGLGPVPHSQS